MDDYQIKINIKYGKYGESQYPVKFLFRNEELYGIYEVRSNAQDREIKLKYIGDINSEIKGLISFTGKKYIKHKLDIILTPEEANRLYPEYFI